MRYFLTVITTTLVAALLFASRPTEAQFASPTVNGAIGASEYGVHTDGQNQQSTGTGQNWYMTWDDTNLYVGITNANLAEGAVIYIDKDPIAPANGGTNANGNLTGSNYDNTSFSALPFRADFVTYFKDGYRELRTADGAGGWSGPTAFAGSYASGSGNVRELSIPWSSITGSGRPTSFNFFGYVTSGGGFVYGQVPNDNSGGFIGTTAAYSHYYQVSNTGNGTSTKPFSSEQTSDLSGIQKPALRHDSFDSYYRSPFGAQPAGTNVTLRLRTGHFDVDGVFLRVYTYHPETDSTTGPVDTALTFLENRTENSVLYDIWTITLAAPNVPSILYYKFRVTKSAGTAFYSDAYADDHDNLGQGGEGGASDSEPFPSFQITVFDPGFQTPAWLQNANVYQIFPDRFRNGDITNDYCRNGCTPSDPVFYGDQAPLAHTTWNEAIGDPHQPGPYQNQYGTQFFGGDLKGISDKLDYLQSLGIDAIYLNPIFTGRSNHRYDTDNYLQVDPALGGDAALAQLKTEIDRRGMHLIFDGVFNHSSSDSLYFDRYHRYAPPDGGCESLSSPYRSWYVFFNNNVPCTFTDYEGWFGFDSLPAFVDGNTEVRDFFYRNATDNVMKHWYDRGAGGWRFDVAPDITHDWWRDFRPYAKSYKADGPLIGEIFPDASQWLAGDQMDSVMNYRFRKNVLGFARGAASWSDNDNFGNNTLTSLLPSQFDHALKAVREDYPQPATDAMLNLLDSHDTNRALYVLTELGDSGLTEAKERLKLAALFQFTYFGAPMVYYGDEGALNSPSLFNGSNGPEDDPYNRAPYPWSDETGNANVYGPVDNGVKSFYSLLAHLRKQHQALRTGSFETLLNGDTTASNSDDTTYAFARTGAGGVIKSPAGGGETAIVVLNNGNGSNNASVPVAAYFGDGTTLQDAISGATHTVSGGAVTLTLPARSGEVLFICAAPSNLTYSSNSAFYIQGQSITPNTPSNTGGAAFTYLISPALPAGLNFDSGVITGTPAVSSPTTSYTVTASSACGSTMTSLSITVLAPTAATATISGQVTTADGAALAGVTISLTGANSMTTVADRNGRYRFNNVDTGSFYTVTPALSNYHFVPASRSFSLLGNRTDAIFTAAPDAVIVTNAIDTTEYFVRQQYLDFLDREPDQGGFNYWREQINQCHGDSSCLHERRIDVAAAFFVEREFQDTGSFIYKLYKSAFGRNLSYIEFSADHRQVVGGPHLEERKTAFIEAFVQRVEFVERYRNNLTAESFVDAVLQTIRATSGADLSDERDSLIGKYNSGVTLSQSRGLVLNALANNETFSRSVYNRAFVLMEYFGYLRRDPDRAGYEFWLEVLNNRVPGNYRAMVCAFITSTEYQRRFGPVVTRNNAECAQ